MSDNSLLPLGALGAPKQATVIGLYGVSGVGKTSLLLQLEKVLGNESFTYYEGSAVISETVPGGLHAFQSLGTEEKISWRKRAIESIRCSSLNSGKAAIVTGHLTLSPEEGVFEAVYTESDLEIFSHILYLDEPADVVWMRRQHDTRKKRQELSVNGIFRWLEAEKSCLRQLCYNNSILFVLVSASLVDEIARLLVDFHKHNETHNLNRVIESLDAALGYCRDHQPNTFLVLDGDKTLAAGDTGDILWRTHLPSVTNDPNPLETIFTSILGYSYTAFRQVSLLYGETFTNDKFEEICSLVATKIQLYSEMLSILRVIQSKGHIGAVIVTCGLRKIWTKVLENNGLAGKFIVIGGGRDPGDHVVTPMVKAAIVDHLKGKYSSYIWAFGDSPLDLDMLSRADQAIVVVGEICTRSRSMETELATVIERDQFRAHQLLLPGEVPPRLDTKRLPIITLEELIGSINFEVVHSTDTNAARLLATPMRDASLYGPFLRAAHKRAGYYLSMTHVSDLLGLETVQIPHVQGYAIHGYQLQHEAKTLIIALMRGGEPMALGVSEAFPKAMFHHAASVADITHEHLNDRATAILVDSVINTGSSVLEMIQHIRQINATLRIVVVAGVVQKQAVAARSPLCMVARKSNVGLIALRLSENKYTGTGTTDTGNRLFGTMHLA
ncbi:uracil phosphoribosyltransferase [Aspergillus homomorphus CBS 101889]|uniref:Uracil phosphoribosyltransferase n=1 Tax=Aspergillus homomorphus (strain CBS 101889) TaxID=1450537 RepID=A0A395I6U0_ASPHC|nr:uracil phosphoribosyltransferase [Aspergillus homomorphus CBS 101889]RAL15890.1 uracil phosphoribosyltransferase [Aspergillus homomorphus CBS 101889]